MSDDDFTPRPPAPSGGGSSGGERRELIASIFVATIMAALMAFVVVRGKWLERGKLRGNPVVIFGAGRFEPSGADNVPLLTDIDGDGIEDVIARVRDAKSSQKLVAAFSGSTRQIIWKAGPFRFDAAATHVVLAGDRVLVADDGGNLVVLERTTGKERGRVRLTDRVREDFCAAPDGQSAWLEQLDYRDVRVDLGTNVTARAPRPAWCPPHHAGHGHATSFAPSTVSVPDFQALSVLGDEGRRLAIGGQPAPAIAPSTSASTLPAPSTAPSVSAAPSASAAASASAQPPSLVGPPLLVGLDTKLGPLWKLPLATAGTTGRVRFADVVGGRGYVAYESSVPSRSRMLVIDMANGTPVFDVACSHPGDGDTPSSLVVGRGRVYVAHRVWLDIFDAQTGALIGTIGDVAE